MLLFFSYSSEEPLQDVLHIWGKFIPKVLRSVALIKYSERDTIVYQGIFIIIMTRFEMLYLKSVQLSSENKLVILFSNQQKHIVLC